MMHLISSVAGLSPVGNSLCRLLHFAPVCCKVVYVEREIIKSGEFHKNEFAKNWQALRANAIAALGLPQDARVRIANNAVTLHAKINDAWIPVMNSSAQDMSDWAKNRDYVMRLSITIEK